jgi:hypothetical protein
MEDVLQKLRAARGNFEATRQNVQTNGTPIRSYARIARESVQSSYGVVISSISSVESKIDDVTEKIDRFRQSNAAMVSYCQLHPSTAIFGSAGAVAIPSYFGKSPHRTAPLSQSRSCSLWRERYDYRSSWCCFFLDSICWRPSLHSAQAERPPDLSDQRRGAGSDHELICLALREI